jgi:hypothetical protein
MAVCFGWLMEAAQRAPNAVRLVLRGALFFVVPTLLIVSLGKQVCQKITESRRTDAPSSRARDVDYVTYAREIREMTPSNAVVLSPIISPVVVFYSERHIIRGILDDATLDKVLARLPEVLPGSPFYLAMRPASIPNWPERAQKFPEALKRYPKIKETNQLVLLCLSGNIPTAGSGPSGKDAPTP